jgi:hypothetical protein
VHTELPTEVAYQASSPGTKRRTLLMKTRLFILLDEFALVTAMKEMGVVFFSRTPDSVIINFVNTKLSSSF